MDYRDILAMRGFTPKPIERIEMKLIVTPTLKVANNDKTRAHAFRVRVPAHHQFVEPQYVSDAMLRGQEDEIYARHEYSQHYAPSSETGFITNRPLGLHASAIRRTAGRR
jgi:hypothetical protein